jgi:hypothetical protein
MVRLLVWIVIVFVAAGGFFWAFKSGPTASSSETQKSQQKVFNLVVQNRKLVAGSSTLSVTQGDHVTINITIDEAEELHLHGYDLHVDLQKNQPGSLSFIANASGRFPFELEHSSTELGALEVQP